MAEDDAFQPIGGQVSCLNRARPTNKIDTPSACSGEPHLQRINRKQRIEVLMFSGTNGLI
jgi:hypothetical protein